MSQVQDDRILVPGPLEETPPPRNGQASHKRNLIDLILWGTLGVSLIALAIAVSRLFGGDGPSAELRSVEYVPSITSGGVTYRFEDQEIVEVQLDFTFDESFTAGLDPTSADYQSGLYAKLVKGAHFFNGEQEIELTLGYWPQEADGDSAQEMTLFYVIPSGSAEDLRFTFDDAVLGEGASGIDSTVSP